MRASFFVFMIAFLSGRLSLNFGKETSTTTPSDADVKRYRAETYLKESLKISPLGLDVIVGIDRSVHFKFKAHTNNVRDVFAPKIDTSLFSARDVSPYKKLSWWNPPKKGFGGQVTMAPGRHMNVFYVNNVDKTITFWIHWFES